MPKVWFLQKSRALLFGCPATVYVPNSWWQITENSSLLQPVSSVTSPWHMRGSSPGSLGRDNTVNFCWKQTNRQRNKQTNKHQLSEPLTRERALASLETTIPYQKYWHLCGGNPWSCVHVEGKYRCREIRQSHNPCSQTVSECGN